MKNPSAKTKMRKARKKTARHPLTMSQDEIASAREASEKYNTNLQESINYQYTIEDNFSKDMLLNDRLSNEILYNACMRVAARIAFTGNRGIPWFMSQARMAYHDCKERINR